MTQALYAHMNNKKKSGSKKSFKMILLSCYGDTDTKLCYATHIENLTIKLERVTKDIENRN
jgi:hypothetical protein